MSGEPSGPSVSVDERLRVVRQRLLDEHLRARDAHALDDVLLRCPAAAHWVHRVRRPRDDRVQQVRQRRRVRQSNSAALPGSANYLVGDGETVWAHVEPGTQEALIAYLESMKFFYRVEVADRTADFAVVHLPAGSIVEVPEGVAVRETSYGRDLFLPRADLESYAGKAGPPAGILAYEALRVEQHRPRLGFETDHRTIPHGAGLDRRCGASAEGLLPGPGSTVAAGPEPGPARAGGRGLGRHVGGDVRGGAARGDPAGHPGPPAFLRPPCDPGDAAERGVRAAGGRRCSPRWSSRTWVRRTDGELTAAMGRLVRYEREVSRSRQRLQRTADDCSAEIARRYREGEAQVDDLLV
ncbi:hypothetical protein SHIRM173S_10892 [Streptomyces hirsutus]